MIDGPLAAFHPAMAFNSATTLLPPSVFTRRNLWHAHHGYFTEITAPVCARRLTVVNTDLVMEGERLLLRINSSHRMIHDQALTVADLLDGDAGGQLAWAMNALHDENQQILRDLIEPGLQTRIGLANNPGVAQ
jgi:hypothetical protein